jgi:hypothetical protein
VSRTAHHRHQRRTTQFERSFTQRFIDARTANTHSPDDAPTRLQVDLDYSLRQLPVEDQVRIISTYNTLYNEWKKDR